MDHEIGAVFLRFKIALSVLNEPVPLSDLPPLPSCLYLHFVSKHAVLLLSPTLILDNVTADFYSFTLVRHPLRLVYPLITAHHSQSSLGSPSCTCLKISHLRYFFSFFFCIHSIIMAVATTKNHTVK